MFNNQIIAGSSGQGGGFYSYSIDQSLRFNDGDAPNLTTTYGSAGTSTALGTFSFWMKIQVKLYLLNLLEPMR